MPLTVDEIVVCVCRARSRVVRRENANHDGGFTCGKSSAISIRLLFPRCATKIDWMAMAEFSVSSAQRISFLRGSMRFPADRRRASHLTRSRTAIERVKASDALSAFSLGSIRDGARSLAKGAPMRPGASTLAAHYDNRSLPALVRLGSDRL